MKDIDRIPCHELNHALSDNVLALHEVCRHYFPLNLKFNFGRRNVQVGEQQSLLANIIQARADVHTADLPNIFTGEGRAAVKHDSDLLGLVKNLAQQSVLSTITDADSSVEQEVKNLISLIGQKSVEMYLIHKLIEMSTDDLRIFFHNVFSQQGGRITLTEVDIREAGHLVCVSRHNLKILIEAADFEQNFC